MKQVFTFMLATLIATGLLAQSLTVTYTAGDIPSDKQSPWVGPSSCPGEITVTIPPGNWITGIDVSYTMTSQNGAYMSEQRSRLYSPTTMQGEPQYYQGSTNTSGPFNYNRTGLTFANFATGNVVIQMDAGRVYGDTSPMCGTYYIYVNNNTWTMTIHYTPIPSCPAPFSLSVSNITTSGADLAWISSGTESLWNIKYGAPGFDPLTEGTLVANVSSNPYTLTGLSVFTQYEYYVQAVCGASDFSDWAGPMGFTTNANPLSGNYTINSLLPTAGNNFTSFNDFTVAINTGGLSGPVNVTVVAGSGPYNEQVIFTELANSSPVNTLTIQGNGETLQFLSTNTIERATLKFDGTDYVTVDNLVVKALGSATGEFGWAVWLTNGADHNTFTNCEFASSTTTMLTNNFAAFVTSNTPGSYTSAQTGIPAQHLTIDNCLAIGGASGIVITGPTTFPFATNNSVTNSDIKDFASQGLYLFNQNNGNFSSNKISRPTRTTSNSPFMIQITGNMSGSEITKNEVSDFLPNHTSTISGYGIYGTSVSASSPGPDLLVANNVIYGYHNVNSAQEGISFYSSSHIKIYHNSISLDHISHTGTGNIRGIVSSGNLAQLDIRNNIISITTNSSGNKHVLYFFQGAANLPVLTSDNNVLHMGATSGNNYLVNWNGAGGPNFSNLASWQTSGYDLNSVSQNPGFTNPLITPNNPNVNNIGTNALLSVVADDIFGALRGAQPDPGAIEFDVASCILPWNLAATNITSSQAQLSWTDGNNSPASFDIELGPAGFTPTETPTQAGVTIPYIYGGLQPQTAYDWYVRTNCGTDGYSIWAGPHTFSTLCAPTDLPWCENFDNVTAPIVPPCITVSNNNNDQYQWVTFSSNANSAPNAMIVYHNYLTGSDDWFFSPGLNLVAGTTYEVNFVYRNAFDGYPERLKVRWGTQPNSAGMIGGTVWDNNNINNSWYEPAQGTFTPPATGVYYIGWHAYSGTDAMRLYVDDICVDVYDPGIPENLPVTGAVSGSECFNASESIAVSNSAVQNGSNVEFRSGGTITASNFAMGNASVEMTAVTSISLQPNIIIAPGASGFFLAQIGSFNPCVQQLSLMASEDLFVPEERSEIKTNESLFKVFPNPTTGIFTLEFTTADALSYTKVEIFNMMGNVIYQTELSGSNLHEINISHMPRGVYIVRIIKGDTIVSARLIKQ